nr:unnamed protein product [Digitaria exilis]
MEEHEEEGLPEMEENEEESRMGGDGSVGWGAAASLLTAAHGGERGGEQDGGRATAAQGGGRQRPTCVGSWSNGVGWGATAAASVVASSPLSRASGTGLFLRGLAKGYARGRLIQANTEREPSKLWAGEGNGG